MKEESPMNIKNCKRILLISLGIVILGIVAMIMTNGFIWEISRMVFFAGIGVASLTLIVCTVISTKTKEKLPLWISILQGLAIALIIAFIIAGFNNRSINNQQQQLRQQVQLERNR